MEPQGDSCLQPAVRGSKCSLSDLYIRRCTIQHYERSQKVRLIHLTATAALASVSTISCCSPALTPLNTSSTGVTFRCHTAAHARDSDGNACESFSQDRDSLLPVALAEQHGNMGLTHWGPFTGGVYCGLLTGQRVFSAYAV